MALNRIKVRPKTNLYHGAFEQLVCPRREAFAGLVSKNPNAQGSAGWVGGDGLYRK